jgi:hypothetical protein
LRDLAGVWWSARSSIAVGETKRTKKRELKIIGSILISSEKNEKDREILTVTTTQNVEYWERLHMS